MKSILIEAYHMGPHEMLYIIPFVAKIIESCAKSKVKINEKYRINLNVYFD